MPEPQFRVYPCYTVVAEKLEALTSPGMLNSRMKDFFDLWVLAKHSDFDGLVLSRAIAVTFERRLTFIPQRVPIGLSDEFINDAQKEKQRQAFMRKNALDPMPLAMVIADLREFPTGAGDDLGKRQARHGLAGRTGMAVVGEAVRSRYRGSNHWPLKSDCGLKKLTNAQKGGFVHWAENGFVLGRRKF